MDRNWGQRHTWRVRELSDLKHLSSSTEPSYRATMRKASLPLVYAHWEGHIKFVSETFVRYVAVRKINIEKLSPSFRAMALHEFFQKNFGKRPGYSERIQIVQDFSECLAGQFRTFPKDCIDTGSNLNSSRTEDLCGVIGCSFQSLAIDNDWLDSQLLAKRNHIAHGADKVVEPEELVRAIDNTISYMRSFKDEVSNIVAQDTYKKY
ncbi:MAG: hypothetical protein LCH88_04740 [Proteobacteria bacterium]|nr:hypothetical protein [Pseudomonadota bacterium]